MPNATRTSSLKLKLLDNRELCSSSPALLPRCRFRSRLWPVPRPPWLPSARAERSRGWRSRPRRRSGGAPARGRTTLTCHPRPYEVCGVRQMLGSFLENLVISSHLGSNTDAATLWKAAAAGMRHRSEAKHSTDWEWANWAAKAEDGLGRDLQNSKKKPSLVSRVRLVVKEAAKMTTANFL